MPGSSKETYPLRAVSRLTGISPELLRAWERRYGVVEPLRSPGGTRRYRASDLERLRQVKAAVDAGHRIGEVARLDPAELERRTRTPPALSVSGIESVLTALDRLDAIEAQRLLSLQLSAMGPVRFAREFALPLVREIGDRWANRRMAIASEHLATAVLRSLLGSALMPTAAAQLGPTIVFGTPSGERHELGLQMAALTAMGAGANPIYLGAELPVESMLEAVDRARANVLALSLVTVPIASVTQTIRALRAGLPDPVRLWIGGGLSAEIEAIDGVEKIGDLDDLERRVGLLGYERSS